ncbi:MAP3K7 C-terminal-like protein [Lepisosteus oculatus]|uniref:Map3k7 C-terminal like n=1 Tax=Lepisosteus oculatus TaxID=7918 RepID=W5MRN8_LEPOC|nr:PREDICTED: MAP3K7 C-terminal-like protein [Lepisosteus oculatus]
MITTTRHVSPDKPEVQIAFSLNDSTDLKDAEESLPLTFPDLEQQLQPLPPYQSLPESLQVYKDHCKMAKEFHDVKKEIARLEERKKELIAALVEDEMMSQEASHLQEEFSVLAEENRTLITVQSQRSEQLEKLRVLNQKRQGSS